MSQLTSLSISATCFCGSAVLLWSCRCAVDWTMENRGTWLVFTTAFTLMLSFSMAMRADDKRRGL